MGDLANRENKTGDIYLGIHKHVPGASYGVSADDPMATDLPSDADGY